MLLLAPKLSEKTINNQLLKYFAKLQMDQEVLLYGGSVCFLLSTSVVMEQFSLDCRKKSKISGLFINYRKFSDNSGTCLPKLHEYFMLCSHGWFTIMVLSIFYTCISSFLFVYTHVEEYSISRYNPSNIFARVRLV